MLRLEGRAQPVGVGGPRVGGNGGWIGLPVRGRGRVGGGGGDMGGVVVGLRLHALIERGGTLVVGEWTCSESLVGLSGRILDYL